MGQTGQAFIGVTAGAAQVTSADCGGGAGELAQPVNKANIAIVAPHLPAVLRCVATGTNGEAGVRVKIESEIVFGSMVASLTRISIVGGGELNEKGSLQSWLGCSWKSCWRLASRFSSCGGRFRSRKKRNGRARQSPRRRKNNSATAANIRRG
jgi:hypothetical protein